MNPKKIALVAHDNKKHELMEWVGMNREKLLHHQFFATGTTGRLISEALNMPVHRFRSGPLGGDQQIGAKIAEGEIDLLFSFGILWSLCRTTLISRPCCGWLWFGTCRLPVIDPRQIL